MMDSNIVKENTAQAMIPRMPWNPQNMVIIQKATLLNEKETESVNFSELRFFHGL